MERPRIVHYVKSRTFRVINPPKTNRHLSSSASSLTAMGKATVAPLASVESDLIVNSKRRSSTDSPRGRIRKPISENDVSNFDTGKSRESSSPFDQPEISETNAFKNGKGDHKLCLSRLGQSPVSENNTEPEKEDRWSSLTTFNQSSRRVTLTSSSQPDKRSGVRNASSDSHKICSNSRSPQLQSNGGRVENSDWNDTQRLEGLRSKCRLPQGPTLTAPSSQTKTPQDHSNSSSSCHSKIRNPSQQSIDHNENPSFRTTNKTLKDLHEDIAEQFTRNTQTGNKYETTMFVSKNDGGYTKKTVVSKLSPDFTSKCDGIYDIEKPENRSHTFPYSRSSNKCVTKSFLSKEVSFSDSKSPQNTNHSVSDIQTDSAIQEHSSSLVKAPRIIGQQISSTPVSNDKSVNFKSPSPVQNTVKPHVVGQEYERFNFRSTSGQGIDLLPNKCLPNTKSSKNAWNLSADNEMFYFPTNYEPQQNSGAINDDKPDSLHNEQDSEFENVFKNAGLTDSCISYIEKVAAASKTVFNDGSLPNKHYRKQGAEQMDVTQKNISEGDINSKKSSIPVRELDVPSSRWKRNSWRLATQGYTSMSDLTSSVECLKLNEFLENGNIEEPIGNSSDYLSQEEVFTNTEEPHMHSDALGPSEQPKLDEHDTNRSGNLSDIHLSGKEALDSHIVSDLDKQRTKLGRSPVKRDSFRLATAGICDVFILGDEVCKSNKSEPESATKCLKKDVEYKSSSTPAAISLHSKKEYRIEECVDPSILYKSEGSPNMGESKCSVLEKTDSVEYLNRIKRRSFMLATSSISDLSCAVDEISIGECSPVSSMTHKNDNSVGDSSTLSFTSEEFHTPQPEKKHSRELSISSSRLNSSFGSFYSCQSTISPRPSPDLRLFERSKRSGLSEESSTIQNSDSRGRGNSKGSDESFSEDSGIYYTGSNASFLTGGDISNNTLKPTSEKRKITSKAPTFQWWRKSPYNHPQNSEYQKSKRGLVGHNFEKTRPRSDDKKHPLKPVSTVFHCYGCGLDSGLPLRNQKPASKNWTNDKKQRPNVRQKSPEKEKANASEFRSRCHTAPTTSRPQIKKPDIPFRTPSGQRRVSDYSAPPSREDFFNRSLSRSPSPDLSFDEEFEALLDSKRSPPSLGRPKRKLYAGFDSQPLPMDSFLSDSSSVYSVDAESLFQDPSMSGNLTPSVRSVSSIVSGTTTPTRLISEDNTMDFFQYNKQKGEGDHDYSFQDRKTFSDESLSSTHSTATATSTYDNDIYNDVDNPSDSKCEAHRQNTNETKQFQRLSLDMKPYFDSRSTDSRDQCADQEDYTVQQRPLKASSSVSTPRSRFPPRRKYFSSKDIFDLIMTSEKNAGSGATSLTSLEKQAQKVCRVILCCNEMNPAAPVREYHF